MALGESPGRTSGRDRERQRFAATVSFTVEQTVASTVARKVGLPRAVPSTQVEKGTESARRRDRSWASAVKRTLIRGRIAARWFGAGRCGVGGELRLVVGVSAVAGRRGASREARKSGDLLGCSLREVGCRSRREASSTQRRGEPRGEPRGSAVARRGGSVPDEGSFIVSGERVRSRVQRT